MATVNFRIDNAARDELDRLAAQLGTTTSDLLRTQVDALLHRNDAETSNSRRVARLTPYDRHLLATLHDIQGQLDADQAEYHEQRARVLRYGFTLEYADQFVDVDTELSPADCRFVRDVLAMFRIIKFSVSQLPDAERASLGDRDVRRLRFRGFDGNDARESLMAAYVDHLIDTGRWQESRDDVAAADGGNSHSPMIGDYTSMLQRYEVINRNKNAGHGFDAGGRAFDLAELTQVIDR